MLHLYTSNRLEALLEQLAHLLAEPLRSVFAEENIIVQSLGMRRWLSLELATRLGVCANTAFPFPQTFFHKIFAMVFPEHDDHHAFDRTHLTWRIMKLLPPLLEKPEFASLQQYLSGERVGLKRFQLAAKIAHVFDEYFAFRPEMILGWDTGKEKHWQSVLWRKLAADARVLHPPALGKKLIEALPDLFLRSLPARVSVFGISTLPPFHLQLLEALARQIDVHLFVLEPTPEWWADIKSPREAQRLRRKAPGAELHIDRGNPLLASLGKAGRDFLRLLFELNPGTHKEPFAARAETSLLSTIQSDIFHLRDPEGKRPAAPEDQSIQIHACHSAMREMEVLHDQLLALFDHDPTLMPKDVLVMMPDVGSYAPFIEAVFDTPEEDRMRIPFTIADRGGRSSSGVLDAFLQILELAGTRLPASSVLVLLECESIQRRFELTSSDLETIRNWIRKTAIRWGIDASHRVRAGVPEFAQNSWRAGLDRLLLGCAMTSDGGRLFDDVLPFDEIEGSLAETLGNFLEFAERLFSTVRDLEKPRSLDGWRGTLRVILDAFFDASGETGAETVQIRGVISALGEAMRLSGFTEPIPLDVLLAHLAGSFEAEERSSGFLAGRVTFCALKPMRSIPFKVICLAGMNDTAFPRSSAVLGFDLIAAKPRLGDRTLRTDDRYLFLETLLSARDTLLISYVGQSMRDNSALPPSVVVSELVDYIDAHFETTCGSVKEQLVTRHPLQPFSASYFRGGRLFSYSRENCKASETALAPRAANPPFVEVPLPEPEAEWRSVHLKQLVRFFRNPADFFLRERLGLAMPREDEGIEDREPFEIGALVRYGMAQRLTAAHLSREQIENTEAAIRAAGELPPAHAGDSLLRGVRNDAEEFAETVRAQIEGKLCPPFSIEQTLGEWRLTGTIEERYSDKLLRYRCAKVQPKDLLALWIPHLILNRETAQTSVLAGQDLVLEFHPEPDAESLLRPLLELYWRGLREPIRFFPVSSLKFASLTLFGDGKKDPLKAAQGVWHGGKYQKAENSSPAFDLAFAHTPDPLDETFQQIALEVFQPLLSNCPEARRCRS